MNEAKETIKTLILDYIKTNQKELVKENEDVNNSLIDDIKNDKNKGLEWFLQEIFSENKSNFIEFIEEDGYFCYIFEINNKLVCYKDVYGIGYRPEYYFVERKEQISFVYERIGE